MKYFALIFIALYANFALAQNYNNIVNYSENGTPTYGVKIKTNLPFLPTTQMPTISIIGYNYGSSEPINLSIVYYTYSGGSNFDDPENYYFHSPAMSSSAPYTPKVLLSAENGKVVIFIDDKSYYQRFTVSAYAQGMSEEASWFQGWTAVDEALNGTKTVEIPYINKFKGDMAVNGKIRAKEIKVEATGWPDYVFDNGYKVGTLEELESYIKNNKHLPEIPSAKEVETSGIALGEMNKLLLKKVEELTLHLIEQNKRIEVYQATQEKQQKEIEQLKSILNTKP